MTYILYLICLFYSLFIQSGVCHIVCVCVGGGGGGWAWGVGGGVGLPYQYEGDPRRKIRIKPS